MITNKELIENQLERINEKMNTHFSVHYYDDKCCICYCKGKDFMMPPFPLNNDLNFRTEEQMIEYLGGVEDAVDFFTHNGTATGN